ncbi:MAG TPA: homocysteine S-methyltransferase family protein [Geopsychrobacteraceae bacterium]|nr:homocysteine S-methyltransferase family protein [Geopsychrobacteraceae bacterium]
MQAIFPSRKSDVHYLTEGGTETEIMYKFGHELPHFAMYPLLDNPKAVRDLERMFQRYLETVAQSGFSALMGGLDYRASPDWGKLLGYSAGGLAEMQHRSIEFLRDVAKPYNKQIASILFVGIVGPKGDAYSLNRTITAEESEDYHSIQLETLKDAKVDFVWAATFNNIPEAVGLSRAAARIGLPLCISFTLDSSHKLKSGPTLKEAILSVDAEAGDNKPICFGINCSHPLELEPALEPGNWIERVRNIRPNAVMMEKISLCKLGHLEEGNPSELGEQMGALAKRFPHIDMWGGCCGTWEAHLKEIARQVA